MKSIRKYIADILIVLFSVLVAATIAIVGNNLELSVAFIALPLSYLSAKHFGDVAGQKAARIYAEEEAKKARIIALRALLNEVQRIRDLAKKNSELVMKDRIYNTRGAVRMPVSSFETVLVSRESSILNESRDTPHLTELLTAIREYLTEAYSINALIEVRLAAIVSHGTGHEQRSEPTREIKTRSDNLPEILGRLEKCLRGELDRALSS